MIQIRHNYDDVAYYLQKDYPVYVKDVRGRYLPMVIYGVRVDKRDGKLKLRVYGARSKWLKAKNHHVLYTDATEGPATREGYNPNEGRENARRMMGMTGIAHFSGVRSMNVSGSFITSNVVEDAPEPTPEPHPSQIVHVTGGGGVESYDMMSTEIREGILRGDVRMTPTPEPRAEEIRPMTITENRQANIEVRQTRIQNVGRQISNGEISVTYSELRSRAANLLSNAEEIEDAVSYANMLLQSQQRISAHTERSQESTVNERTRGMSSIDRIHYIAAHIVLMNRGNLTTSVVSREAQRFANSSLEVHSIIEQVVSMLHSQDGDSNISSSQMETRTRGMSTPQRISYIINHIVQSNRDRLLNATEIENFAGRYARTFSELSEISTSIQRVQREHHQRVAENNLSRALRAPMAEPTPLRGRRQSSDNETFPF